MIRMVTQVLLEISLSIHPVNVIALGDLGHCTRSMLFSDIIALVYLSQRDLPAAPVAELKLAMQQQGHFRTIYFVDFGWTAMLGAIYHSRIVTLIFVWTLAYTLLILVALAWDLIF